MTVDSRTQTWLVLGATGFLGRHLLEAARGPGRRVVGVGRRLERPGPGEAEEFLELDLLDGGALGGLAADVVLNAAALSRIGDCDQDPALARRTNVGLPARLAERDWRLVHVSTDLVFGHQPVPRAGFREEDEPRPASAYGETKLAGERAVAEICPDALVLRVPLLYGRSRGAAAGASDSLLAAVARGERPRLFRDEWRTPLDVAAAARAIVRAAGTEARGLWHVAGPERLSRLELGLRVLGAAHGWTRDEALARVEPVDRADLGLAARPPDTSLDGRRAARRFGLESPASPGDSSRTA